MAIFMYFPHRVYLGLHINIDSGVLYHSMCNLSEPMHNSQNPWLDIYTIPVNDLGCQQVSWM